MQNSLLHKRIPTLFGIILLVAGFFAINYAVNHTVFFITKASPTYTPEEIRVTNLTDTSFTISYVTQDSVLGTLTYDTTPTGNKVALDDRDQQSGTPQPYLTHHITVKNLSPNTAYYYSILSSNKTFLDKDKPFSVKTLAPLTQNPSRQTPIVGTVADTDGSHDTNTIVLLVTDGAQTLSTLTKADGTFVMPLNALRTKDFSSYISFTPTSLIKLLIENPKGKATVSVLASQINPVPLITLNNSYDFTASSNQSQVSPVPIASASADTSSFPSFVATEAGPKEPAIASPDRNEELHDSQPQFDGTALPNTEVQIEIHSTDPITTTVTSNKNGSWTYRPTTKLEPGEHTITIKTKNSQGILQTITRNFTVFAEGSQFTEPSVSPVQPTATPLPEITITPTPTLTPTLIASPTATPVLVPSDILTQPPQPITTSPGSSITVISGILGTLAIGTGILLLLMARGTL
jgi:hypothetical protein